MHITKELLEQVAKNARLELTQIEKEEFAKQFEDILSFFDTLKEFKDNEEPAFHPIPLKDEFREDKVQPSLTVEQALSQTDKKKDSYFKGPKAI